ncbi:DNA repair protein RecN [Gilvimarinus sp. SDUM040013]|uniref:DNA repair protein RecN n=1 Tax=Gilvimarinus gilvus TaxID=3058038 RepID=A0ABU4S634_9GAMM|nr:DNA repair protein RecN [Gilvimarinus sp. SDUM040013]MDO3384716.1 DNA repair protein RecN [Gilvimarinus sp. SDUM040013]MDX6850809.1 DNA repair protein RecN [Gilvimarinus sp. SDUM040013]
MLTHLSVQNFTLVESLDLDFKAGMTVITGETGAGKSVLLEALGQALGDRADATRVRRGTRKADISATFDLTRIERARHWLVEQDLEQVELPSECLLRRTVTAEGRSKAYINGHPATLTQLKTLGNMLMDIHSQHEHQSLLVKDNHRRLIDEYAGHLPLADAVKQAFKHWQAQARHLESLRVNTEELSARHQLIAYQVEELDQLDLKDGELQELETERHMLANAENLLQTAGQLSDCLGNDEMGIQVGLGRALQLLTMLKEKPDTLQEVEQMLQEAQIQVSEALNSVELFSDDFAMDPARIAAIDDRLTTIYDIARKHRVQPEALRELHANLSTEVDQLDVSDEKLRALEADVRKLEDDYRKLAAKLTSSRRKAGKRLGEQVNQHLKQLAMEHAKLTIDFFDRSDKPGPHGTEDVELLISTNPGQPAGSLAKVASGGELSRISLAIQVVAAENSTLASLVFDEVDVGIGGATADTVGQLLRALAERGQIFCVTHLAQVASKGHHHLQVTKISSAKSAATTLVELAGDEKVDELARMLGGARLTDASRAHAEQMLTGSE